MSHSHFLELREAIHARLRTLRPPSWEEQVEDYPWLYGALGDHGADVMFVCENPSLSGLRAVVESPLGGPPDFDTQWTGNPANRRDRRFRKVLCDLGLKDGSIWEPGGWHCYITNVIKQAAIVSEWGESPLGCKAASGSSVERNPPDGVRRRPAEYRVLCRWQRSSDGAAVNRRRNVQPGVSLKPLRDGIAPHL